jgi:hypothetical protein
MPTITLSESALALLRSRVEGGSRHVDDSNREAYRELARAGIMYPVSGFISGPEYLYRFTDEGWERRFERPQPAGSLAVFLRQQIGVQGPGVQVDASAARKPAAVMFMRIEG